MTIEELYTRGYLQGETKHGLAITSIERRESSDWFYQSMPKHSPYLADRAYWVKYSNGVGSLLSNKDTID